MALGAVGFVTANLAILFIALFAMGLHSTLFGPVSTRSARRRCSRMNWSAATAGRVRHIRRHLDRHHRRRRAGGHETERPGDRGDGDDHSRGDWLRGQSCRALAPATDPSLKLNWNPFTETAANLRLAAKNIVVWRSMLGISWLWFYGAMLLNQFANMSRTCSAAMSKWRRLLAVFAVGVAVGSLLCERLSGKKVEIGLVPFGSIGMSLFAIDLYFATKGLSRLGRAVSPDFISKPEHWRVIADLFLLSVSGACTACRSTR